LINVDSIFSPIRTTLTRTSNSGGYICPANTNQRGVIDGQHRLYGFSNIADRFLNNSLFVLAFEKMETKTEAELFITINHEQRSVSKSLLVTLQADLKIGSGDPKEAISALASALVRTLNNDNTSPFFRSSRFQECQQLRRKI
jgi:DGQHR domain-containing protein